MASFGSISLHSKHKMLIYPLLLSLVYFQAKLWCKHFHASGLLGMEALLTCGQVLTPWIALWIKWALRRQGAKGLEALGRILRGTFYTTLKHHVILSMATACALGDNTATPIPGWARTLGIGSWEPEVRDVPFPKLHSMQRTQVGCVTPQTQCCWKWVCWAASATKYLLKMSFHGPQCKLAGT